MTVEIHGLSHALWISIMVAFPFASMIFSSRQCALDAAEYFFSSMCPL